MRNTEHIENQNKYRKQMAKRKKRNKVGKLRKVRKRGETLREEKKVDWFWEVT